MSKSYAPYNFIPFASNPTGDQGNSSSCRLRVPVAYSDRSLLPRHDRMEEGLLSGYISYELINHTSLTIGGKENDFFRDGQGRLVIPGSTMRGHVRSHVEMLSFSYPEMIEDQTYMFRDFAGTGAKRQAYQSILNKNQVKAGWIYKSSNDGTYYIKRLKDIDRELGTYFEIPESDLKEKSLLDESSYMYDVNGRQNPDYTPYQWEGKGDGDKGLYYYKATREIKKISSSEKAPKDTDAIRVLLLNSGYVEGKKHHYVVSAIRDGNGESNSLPIDSSMIDRYKQDLKKNQEQNEALTGDFYKLPSGEGVNRGKVFFYTTDDEGKSICTFGPTIQHRVLYKNPVSKGIPYKKGKGLDYAQAMFGFIEKKGGSYKSRISFQNAVLDTEIDENHDLEEKEMVLLSPRGTALKMYLNPDSDNYKTYQDEDFELRGYKFYWKREQGHGIEPDTQSEGQRAENDNRPDDNATNRRVVSTKVLLKSDHMNDQNDVNRSFKGKIYFENLRKDELGLLLLALRYEDDPGNHESFMIGGGKPYGYGKVSVENIQLYLKDHESSLTCLNPAWNCVTADIPNLKKTYKCVMEKLFENEKSYEEMETVRVLRQYLQIDNITNGTGLIGNHQYYKLIEVDPNEEEGNQPQNIIGNTSVGDKNYYMVSLSEEDIYMSPLEYKELGVLPAAEQLITNTVSETENRQESDREKAWFECNMDHYLQDLHGETVQDEDAAILSESEEENTPDSTSEPQIARCVEGGTENTNVGDSMEAMRAALAAKFKDSKL